MYQKQGTLDFVIQTPTLPGNKTTNSSKGNLSPLLPSPRKGFYFDFFQWINYLSLDNKKNTTVMDKPAARPAPVVEKKEEVKDIIEETNFKYKPNAQEIKDIFQMIVEEAERDNMSP